MTVTKVHYVHGSFQMEERDFMRRCAQISARILEVSNELTGNVSAYSYLERRAEVLTELQALIAELRGIEDFLNTDQRPTCY